MLIFIKKRTWLYYITRHIVIYTCMKHPVSLVVYFHDINCNSVSYIALNDKFSIYWLTHIFWYFLLWQMSQNKSLLVLRVLRPTLRCPLTPLKSRDILNINIWVKWIRSHNRLWRNLNHTITYWIDSFILVDSHNPTSHWKYQNLNIVQ